MKIQEKKILKSSNINLFIWLLYTLFTFGLLTFSVINKGFNISVITITIVLLFFIYLLLFIKKDVIFYESFFEQISFRNKKTLYRCNYEDIKKIHIDFRFDTITRGKLMRIFMKNGKEIKIKLEAVLLDDIKKVFLNKDIPLLTLKKDRYVQLN